MKQLLNKLFFVVAVALLAVACRKDEVKTVMGTPVAPTLTATTTTLALVQANAANEAISFNWTTANYGFKAAVTYTLQLSKKGTNWATATSSEMALGSQTSRKFTIGDINKELLKFLPASQTNDVDVRIKADVAPSVAPVYSNIITIKATPYRDLINYEFPQALRVAGNYQGWDPATALKIVDKNASGTTGSGYEGYINFNNAAPEFKMVKGNNWGAGDFGDAGGGKLGNGGNNFKLTQGAGVYLLKANTQAMTWSATRITTWGIIGDATPGDWGSSTAMTMNADGTYSLTVNLIGGKEMKFRANNAWDINMGDNKGNGGPDNVPDYGGDNIAIATSGNYTITLDLSIAGNYNYTVKRN